MSTKDFQKNTRNVFGLNSILKEAWNTVVNTEGKREKIQALSLAKECYGMKLDLLTNATVVDDAIRFVGEKSKEKLKSTASNREDNEQEQSKLEHDCDGKMQSVDSNSTKAGAEVIKRENETTTNKVF